MAKTFAVQILSPDGPLYRGEAEFLVAVAVDGEIGVLPGHTPLVTALKPGIIRLKAGANEEQIPIGGGFMEVTPEQVNILATAAIKE